ncbi:uncharacterized protein FRV6_07172 [Fusarium oxysporum]|uniref:Uncharacterized protein n=1 Tax=Fusarium oxysporum TaxID=5507 RepID=A0A2H3T5Y8_FUSOX|nr:uncharacterized protein FRV6_07172 [Fusarium oxysporum]
MLEGKRRQTQGSMTGPTTKPSLAQQGEPLNPARQGPDGRNLNSSQGQTQEIPAGSSPMN